MADWPENIADGQVLQTFGSTILTDSTTNTDRALGLRGVSLTPGSPANTKGAWVTVISSVPFDAAGFLLCIPAAGSLAYYVDIAVGTPPTGFPEAAPDTRIVNDFGVFNAINTPSFYVPQNGFSVYMPIGLRAGDMVSARCQRSDVTALPLALDVMIIPISGDPSTACGDMRTYGRTNVANTDTAIITPYGAPNSGNLAGTKGPYTYFSTLSPLTGQLVNFVTEDISQIIIHFSTRQFTAENTQRWYVDIATGLPGSETVIIPNLAVETNSTSNKYGTVYLGPIPCSIPAGSVISARCAMNISGVASGPVGIGMLIYAFA